MVIRRSPVTTECLVGLALGHGPRHSARIYLPITQLNGGEHRSAWVAAGFAFPVFRAACEPGRSCGGSQCTATEQQGLTSFRRTGMLPRNVLYYGDESALPERKSLQAGPLSLIYEVADLRYIRLGDREVLRRVYVAVRDRNWKTIIPILSNVTMDVSIDSFCITYDAESSEGDIKFVWTSVITGNADGTITYTMDGSARSTFLRNRIGLCVLHPIRECAGQPCIVEKIDGTVHNAVFPRHISPQQPIMDIKEISHMAAPGVRATVRFAGDTFEMEDQRNWTDASYKTYSTPLALPFPAEIRERSQISQSVRLDLKGKASRRRVERRKRDIAFTLTGESRGPLPGIGLGLSSHERPLSQNELARLRGLNLHHLRVDLNLSEPGHQAKLYLAVAQAGALGVPLEIALFLSDAAADELRAFVRLLDQVKPGVCTWLIFQVEEKSTTERWIRLAREHLQAYDRGAKIGAGTSAYFTELNRSRPPLHELDLVSYSLNPQVHAFDNTSLVETLEIQAATIESARRFVGTVPLAIGPITLKPRFNPDATAASLESVPGSLPSQVDVRQMSLFGAGWTAGSLKYICEGGVHSVTYYETVGWRGVMETEGGSPLPKRFRSLPGSVFPLYHVMADIGEFAMGEVVLASSSETLLVDGFAVRKDGKTRVVIANLGPEARPVTARGLDDIVRAYYLDETNVEEAMLSPESFRAREGQLLQTSGGILELKLPPYAIARIDTESETR